MQNATLQRAAARLLRYAVPDGGPRHRALKDLRCYSKERARIDKVRRKAVTGYVLAKRAQCGAARPWDLGVAARVLQQQCTKRTVEVVAWVLGAEKGFKREGLRISHGDFAKVLGCSVRSAGTAVRAAVAFGYLERLPWFTLSDGETGGPKHNQRECCYRLTDQFRAFLESLKNRGVARRLLVGKVCQPTEIQVAPQPKKVSAAPIENCTTPARPVDNTDASSMAAAAAKQLRREKEQAACRAHVPTDIADALDPDLLPSVAAAMASFNRRFPTTN